MPKWQKILACPDCLGDLDEELSCNRCARTYPAPHGVPRLFREAFPDRQRLKSTDGSAMAAGYRRPSSFVSALRRVVTSEYFPGQAWREAKARTLGNGDLCLILGSGVTRYPNGIHLDLDDFPGVDVVADAHRLPFRDNCLDGLVCEVVLEHVHKPDAVIAEAFRVLRPGGRCFFIAPFLFPFHGHPGDYRRWSRQGLCAEFSAFDDLETGIHAGPCSAMFNLFTEWFYLASGLRFPKGYTLLKGLGTLLFFPFKFLDALIVRFPEAHRMAATLYIAGRKPEPTSSPQG